MKWQWHTLVSILSLSVPLTLASERTTPITLICFSPQIDRAIVQADFGTEYRLEFTSLDNGEVNGELMLAPSTIPYDLYGMLVMETPFEFEPIFLAFALDWPAFTDENGNGLDDFLDDEAAINQAPALAVYESPFFGGIEEVSAVWHREAGSLTGTLSLEFPDLGFTSVHGFRLFEFQGEFTHTLDGNQLSGSINLTNTWDTGNHLIGPLSLTVIDHETLSWEEGEWTDTYESLYPYVPVEDIGVSGDFYFGLLRFIDGYPWTWGEDYRFWVALLDGRDHDGDGTPDLVQGGTVGVVRPTLSLMLSEEGATIQISGQAGASYTLESLNAIGGSWTEIQTVVMTGESHSLGVAAPGGSRFFRLRF